MFKELIQNDINNIFLNLEEFAEVHSIDNKEMTIIIDTNERLEREKNKRLVSNLGDADGLFREEILIYVSSKYFKSKPKIGRLMILDDKPYRVLDVIDETGIYSITLGAELHR